MGKGCRDGDKGNMLSQMKGDSSEVAGPCEFVSTYNDILFPLLPTTYKPFQGSIFWSLPPPPRTPPTLSELSPPPLTGTVPALPSPQPNPPVTPSKCKKTSTKRPNRADTRFSSLRNGSRTLPPQRANSWTPHRARGPTGADDVTAHKSVGGRGLEAATIKD
jgi:hypothetical protein